MFISSRSRFSFGKVVKWLSRSKIIFEEYEFIDKNSDTTIPSTSDNQKIWTPIRITGCTTTVTLEQTKILLIRLNANLPMILSDWIPLFQHVHDHFCPATHQINSCEDITPSPQLILPLFLTDNDLWICWWIPDEPLVSKLSYITTALQYEREVSYYTDGSCE